MGGEVRWTLDQLPYNKAPGCNNIQTEILNAIMQEIMPTITILCNKVWEKTKWWWECKHSIFIRLPKQNVTECTNKCTIALISHASKSLLRIIQKQFLQYIECEMLTEQAVFRKGRGTGSDR